MKKKLVVIIFITINFNLFTQNSFVDSVIRPLQKDQLFFEKVYLHTNKETYNFDDIVWFKAYVVDVNNKPSLNTTLLYVNLLDEKGNLITSKNVFINEGVGINQIELPSNKNSQVYYIQAYTNYMKNFGEKNYFLKKIFISGKQVTEKQINEEYDVQIYPEGGFFLEEVENKIGLKVTKNGCGINYQGEIKEVGNSATRAFKEEHKGMSKVNFFYKKGVKYEALIHLKDTVLIKTLPQAFEEGVLLHLENNQDSVKVHLKSKFKTLKNREKYTLLFHNFNKLINYFEIPDFELNETKTVIIAKNSFLEGVNTVTLFENNAPISERKFFIEKKNNKSSILLQRLEEENDSITYSLAISDINNNPLKVNISIAILLDRRSMFHPDKDIFESFNLSPFTNNLIEEPSYYFDNLNIKKKKYLDLLLMNQKTKKDNFKEMISELNPTYKFNFELGFNLKGSLSPVITDTLALITSKNKLIDKVRLRNNKNFNFKKLLIYKGDTVKISFLKNEEALSPKKINWDSLKTKPHPEVKHLLKPSNYLVYNENFFINPENIKLDEVEIKVNRVSKQYLRKKRLVKKYKAYDRKIGMYDFLNLNSKYKDEESLMSFLFKNEGIHLEVWKGIEKYLQTGTTYEAILIIDGRRIFSEELPVSLQMSEIENIAVLPIKGNKIVQVFTTENYKKNIVNLFKEYVIKNGYDKEEKYFPPVLNIDNPNIIHELDWKPILKNSNTENRIVFKLKKDSFINEEDIIFYIQGISNRGILINDIIRSINLN
ncbi:hypothetical protein [Tenacibaculum sp. IB213877]|uniref:hypothetical protein n=1 Tax=Tenacibaculum sp. IB213877 TaxID=3097351 RepID=UPI002A5A1F56|nr:hypothetical protein [Tenacibaculum sp. IB213877]MDY0780495.1 hypothetical protein [Tenacibaculum sp. IB213877]